MHYFGIVLKNKLHRKRSQKNQQHHCLKYDMQHKRDCHPKVKGKHIHRPQGERKY